MSNQIQPRQPEVSWEADLITEVVRDAVMKHMKGHYSVAMIVRMTRLTSNGLVEFLRTRKHPTAFSPVMTDFQGFILICRILAEVEKTIPAVADIIIRCESVTRFDMTRILNDTVDRSRTT